MENLSSLFLTKALAYTSTTDAETAATVVGGVLIFWFIVGLVRLGFFIWWIVLLVDLSKREFPEKNTYLILMILALFIPVMLEVMCLVYYFGVVKKSAAPENKVNK